jgi:hypothetical protein
VLEGFTSVGADDWNYQAGDAEDWRFVRGWY